LVGKQNGGTPRPRTCTAWKQTNIVCQIKSASCSPSLTGRLFTGTSSLAWNSRKRTLDSASIEWLSEWSSRVQTAAGDTRRKTLSNLWYTRVHQEWTVRKERLVDSVGQALQGSNSCRGSSILEGGSADRRIEKPTVTATGKLISS
jgi:hypothetical protein